MDSFSVLRNNLHKTLIINYKSLLQFWLYTPGEVYEEELVSGMNPPSVCVPYMFHVLLLAHIWPLPTG